MSGDVVPVARVPVAVPVARMFRPRCAREVLVILGEPRPYWLHWLGRRSYPCRYGECPKDVHRKPCQLVTHYPAAFSTNLLQGGKMVHTWDRCVFPAGVETVERVQKCTAPGMLVELIFGNEGKPGRPRLLEVRPIAPIPSLPTSFDVTPTLYRAWGIRYDLEVLRAAAADQVNAGAGDVVNKLAAALTDTDQARSPIGGVQ